MDEAGIKDVDYAALGKRLKKVRLLRRYTQEGLAEKSGVIGSFIGVVERAEKKPSISTLVKIANALNCSVDYMLYDSLVKGEDRIYSINGDTADNVDGARVGNLPGAPLGDIADLSRSLLPLLSGTGSMNREREVGVILEILRNITAYYSKT